MATMKPLKPCNSPACSKLTRERYCEDHQVKAQEQNRERHKHYDKYQRDKESTAFYKSIEWLRAREQALIRDHGLCQHCIKDKRMTMAEMVDHKIPLKIARHLGTCHMNLQSLCNQCHAIKTAEDKRKYGSRL